MKQTVVPNRNMIFLSLAGARALSEEIPHLFYAAHAGDHAIYPDCRPVFVSAMETVLHLYRWPPCPLPPPLQGRYREDRDQPRGRLRGHLDLLQGRGTPLREVRGLH